ncbi:MAG: phytanoyl-CoA dioxygenase family protein [Alphaproteobacteria bacterium]
MTRDDELFEQMRTQGWAVLRQVVPSEIVDACIAEYEATVKPYEGEALRQSTNPEKHILSEAGHIVNGLLNSHIPGQCPPLDSFSRTVLAVVTHDNLQAAIRRLSGRQTASCMQTMVFDFSPATMAHQDCVYLDSVPSGAMIAAWVALEDIAEDAGRFYVLPLDQTPPLPPFSREEVFEQHSYMPAVERIMTEHAGKLIAPALNKGDAIFWSSRTIHGAFAAADPARSRRSIAAHYVPEGYDFGNVWGRIYRPKTQTVNGMTVRMPRLTPAPTD